MKERATIMEIRQDTVVVMTESCDFLEVPCPEEDLFIGMEFELFLPESHYRKGKMNPVGFSFRKATAWAVVAAMVMFILVGSFFLLESNVFAQPAYLININLNPSVALTLDAEGRVIKAEALDDEAEMLDLRGLRKMEVEEALEGLIRASEEAGFLTPGSEHYMIISLVPLNPRLSQESMDQLLERTQISMKEETEEVLMQVQILALPASRAQLDEAAEREVPLNEIVVRDAFRAMRAVNNDIGPGEKDEEEPIKMVDQVREMLREKPHPVFQTHPGAEPGGTKVPHNQRNGDHPGSEIEDQPGQGMNQKETDRQDHDHPVFEIHPGSRRLEDDEEFDGAEGLESRENHPVFSPHPGRQAGNGESNQGQ